MPDDAWMWFVAQHLSEAISISQDEHCDTAFWELQTQNPDQQILLVEYNLLGKY